MTKIKRSPVPASVRTLVLDRDECCRYCGTTAEVNMRKEFHIDHVVPVSRGGSDDPDNLVVACDFCNRDKHDMTPDEWAARRQELGLPWPIPNRWWVLVELSRKSVELGVLVTEPSPAAGDYLRGVVDRSRLAGFDIDREAAAYAAWITYEGNS